MTIQPPGGASPLKGYVVQLMKKVDGRWLVLEAHPKLFRRASPVKRVEVVVPVDVLTEIVIDRPRGEVATYAADPSNAPEWYVNIKAVEWKTAPPPGVGSRLAFVAHFLGRRFAYTYEIVDLVPGERMIMRTAEGPFPMETTYTWEATDGGG